MVAVVAIIVLAVVLSNNVVYFRTVSEAVDDRHSSERPVPDGGRGRAGVGRGDPDGVRFEITDGKATVEVVHHR